MMTKIGWSLTKSTPGAPEKLLPRARWSAPKRPCVTWCEYVFTWRRHPCLRVLAASLPPVARFGEGCLRHKCPGNGKQIHGMKPRSGVSERENGGGGDLVRKVLNFNRRDIKSDRNCATDAVTVPAAEPARDLPQSCAPGSETVRRKVW